jgi:hypothetical protein
VQSRVDLAAARNQDQWLVSSSTVARLLDKSGYGLESAQKTREGITRLDHSGLFEHIPAKAGAFLQRPQPVISVDTKKKKLIGDPNKNGRERQLHLNSIR